MSFKTVGIIGFGEAGKAFASGLLERVDRIIIYDSKKLYNVPTRIEVASDLQTIAEGSDLLISCIWPGVALSVAQGISSYLQPRHTYCDFNNISPQATISIQAVIEDSGASFVKGAVMSPIAEKGARVPILLGGKTAEILTNQLTELGLNVKFNSCEPQVPAATKILRSILLKGIVALAYETYWAAEAFGAGHEVLESGFQALSENPLNLTVENWMNTSLVHAQRRAQELGEVEIALQGIGLEPIMASAAKKLLEEVAAKVALKDKVPLTYMEL